MSNRIVIMAKVEKLVPHILKWEGGFVNDPVDRGGATNKGVTFGTYKTYRNSVGKGATVDDLKNITVSEWTAILKLMYWDLWRADLINNQSIANILVDWLWHSGSHGIKIPQRILGVAADGVVGGQTITAVNKADQRKLFDELKAARIEFFDDIIRRNPLQKRFEKGWKNRVNDFKFSE